MGGLGLPHAIAIAGGGSLWPCLAVLDLASEPAAWLARSSRRDEGGKKPLGEKDDKNGLAWVSSRGKLLAASGLPATIYVARLNLSHLATQWRKARLLQPNGANDASGFLEREERDLAKGAYVPASGGRVTELDEW